MDNHYKWTSPGFHLHILTQRSRPSLTLDPRWISTYAVICAELETSKQKTVSSSRFFTRRRGFGLMSILFNGEEERNPVTLVQSYRWAAVEGLEMSGCLLETEHLRRRSQANLQPLANEWTCAFIIDVSYVCPTKQLHFHSLYRQAIVQYLQNCNIEWFIQIFNWQFYCILYRNVEFIRIWWYFLLEEECSGFCWAFCAKGLTKTIAT